MHGMFEACYGRRLFAPSHKFPLPAPEIFLKIKDSYIKVWN